MPVTQQKSNDRAKTKRVIINDNEIGIATDREALADFRVTYLLDIRDFHSLERIQDNSDILSKNAARSCAGKLSWSVNA